MSAPLFLVNRLALRKRPTISSADALQGLDHSLDFDANTIDAPMESVAANDERPQLVEEARESIECDCIHESWNELGKTIDALLQRQQSDQFIAENLLESYSGLMKDRECPYPQSRFRPYKNAIHLLLHLIMRSEFLAKDASERLIALIINLLYTMADLLYDPHHYGLSDNNKETIFNAIPKSVYILKQYDQCIPDFPIHHKAWNIWSKKSKPKSTTKSKNQTQPQVLSNTYA